MWERGREDSSRPRQRRRKRKTNLQVGGELETASGVTKALDRQILEKRQRMEKDRCTGNRQAGRRPPKTVVWLGYEYWRLEGFETNKSLEFYSFNGSCTMTLCVLQSLARPSICRLSMHRRSRSPGRIASSPLASHSTTAIAKCNAKGYVTRLC